MSALVRCILRINPKDITEDEFFEAWGQVAYYLETVQQVHFTSEA